MDSEDRRDDVALLLAEPLSLRSSDVLLSCGVTASPPPLLKLPAVERVERMIGVNGGVLD